jgi:tetratricopeptide (TPR) repeat protein
LEDHPSPETLRRFFSGAISREENACVVRHLVAACEVCSRNLSRLPESQSLLSRLLELPEQPRSEPLVEVSYDWAFAKATRTATRLIETQRREQDPFAELLLFPQSKLFFQARDRFDSPEAIEALLRQSHELRYKDPRLMLLNAELACLGADASSKESFGLDRAALADLRARCHGQLGNALKLQGRFDAAEDAFSRAETFWREGSGDLVTWAALLERKASLRQAQRRHGESRAVASEAASIYCAMRDPHLVARARVVEAVSCLYSGDAEGSVRMLTSALPSIDGSRDAHLLLAAHHNLASSFLELGQPEEAIAVVDSVRDLYREHDEVGVRLKALWQRGRLLLEVGHLESAEKALKGARTGFAELGLAHEAAEVSLALAEVYRHQGDCDRLKEVLSEVIPIFRSLRFAPDLLAALIRLREATQTEGAASA